MADALPRLVAEKLQARWGQPGRHRQSRAPRCISGPKRSRAPEPDGYTLLAAPQGPLVLSQSLYRKLGYDPAAFVPVTVMARLPYIFVAIPRCRFQNVPELIAYAKANPGPASTTDTGHGSAAAARGPNGSSSSPICG